MLIAILCLVSNAWAESAKFGIAGDAGFWNASSQSSRDSMKSFGVKNLILPGDNLYDVPGGYAQAWEPWSKAGFKFEVVAIGNHTAGYPAEVAYFKMPAEVYSKTIGKLARFIVLNSDHDATGESQARWLDSELSTATEKYIFIVYHHPTYTISKVHHWDEKANFQKAVRPILWKQRSRITALIVGHDHLAELVHFNDLPVIVSGAIHEVRLDQAVDRQDGEVHVKTEWYFPHVPYWVMLDLDSDKDRCVVSFVRANNNEVSCTAELVTGKAAKLSENCFKSLNKGSP